MDETTTNAGSEAASLDADPPASGSDGAASKSTTRSPHEKVYYMSCDGDASVKFAEHIRQYEASQEALRCPLELCKEEDGNSSEKPEAECGEAGGGVTEFPGSAKIHQESKDDQPVKESADSHPLIEIVLFLPVESGEVGAPFRWLVPPGKMSDLLISCCEDARGDANKTTVYLEASRARLEERTNEVHSTYTTILSHRARLLALGDLGGVAETNRMLRELVGMARLEQASSDRLAAFGHRRYRPSVYDTQLL